MSKKGKLLKLFVAGLFLLVVFYIIILSTATWSCGDNLIDERDGNIYRTTVIGAQCFMADNLNYLASNSWCYNEDDFFCERYGRLYDNSSANHSCPEGWHLPSDNEWEELEVFLGMVPFDTGRPGWRISGEVGDKLKSSLYWDGSNSHGFDGLPGGYRLLDGRFYGADIFGRWWTSTTSGNRAWRRHLDPNQPGIFRSIHDTGFGYSVRCVKTEEF